MQGAVQVGLEFDSVLVHFPKLGQRPHLKAAGIGQDRPRPVHEFVQPAQSSNPFRPRAQHQVIGVGENALGAGFGDRVRRHRLDRSGGADGHERWRVDGPMRRQQAAGPGLAVGVENFKIEDAHLFETSCCFPVGPPVLSAS